LAVWRAPDNPIITPADVPAWRDDYEVIGVFNAGVARNGEEVILLLRIAERPIRRDDRVVLSPMYDISTGEIVTRSFRKSDAETDFSDPRLIARPKETYLTSISHLRVARSPDGVTFEVARTPALAPQRVYETMGIEDPRITCIDGTCYITYVAVSPRGVTTCLASTRDFRSVQRHGVVFPPENKDVAFFPGKVNGRYYALHRPGSPLFHKNDIWIAESPDLLCWGNHRHLFGQREGLWDETRIGAGAAPIRLDDGWLEIYHGADRRNRYCLGAVLLDGDKPWNVLARSREPILEPQARYEYDGFFGGVVFTCGLLFEDDKLKVYYGAADTTLCYAEIPLADALATLRS
jgi:predicted GH43/DUF377 family glycosyl hydrolase